MQPCLVPDHESSLSITAASYSPDSAVVSHAEPLNGGKGKISWSGGAATPAIKPTRQEKLLRSSHVCERGLAASLIAFGIGLAVVPTASADPNDAEQTDTPAPGMVTVPAPTSDNVNPAAAVACKQFATTLNFAATNYSGFADATEGTDLPDYRDPTVRNSNVTARTALREAAAAAMTAAATPGLQPEIAAPMRAWSVDATKLLLIMGLRRGGDTLDNVATELNNDAYNAQTACAAAGTHA